MQPRTTNPSRLTPAVQALEQQSHAEAEQRFGFGRLQLTKRHHSNERRELQDAPKPGDNPGQGRCELHKAAPSTTALCECRLCVQPPFPAVTPSFAPGTMFLHCQRLTCISSFTGTQTRHGRTGLPGAGGSSSPSPQWAEFWFSRAQARLQPPQDQAPWERQRDGSGGSGWEQPRLW